MFGDSPKPHITTNGGGGAGIFLPPGAEALLPLVLDALLEPDVRVSAADAPLRIAHRRIDDNDVYFVINDSGQPWEGELDFSPTGGGAQWEPATGRMTAIEPGAGVPVRLDSYGAMLYTFKSAVPRPRKEVQAGDLPQVAVTALPETSPVPSHGEFVTASIETAPSLASADQTAWRVSGTITKGNVDTFVFAAFNYPAPAGLHEAAYIVFDAWLPEAQQAAVPLLVILRDNSGVEYMADTGIPMNAPGHHACYVALNRFRRAGWCPITDRPLDLSNISAINIGWGGYYGSENENVTFSLSPPRLASHP